MSSEQVQKIHKLTDKEVGELWVSIVMGRGQKTSYAVHHSTKNVAEVLIRKLVEERADILSLSISLARRKNVPSATSVSMNGEEFYVVGEDIADAVRKWALWVNNQGAYGSVEEPESVSCLAEEVIL